MIAVIKNDCRRAWENKARIFVMFALMVVSIGVAIFMSSHGEETLRIGFVGEESEWAVSSDKLEVTYLKEAPKTSELIKGTYDAVVQKEGGNITVETIKNDVLQTKLEQLLAGTAGNEMTLTEKKGAGSMMIGYLLMFLLMASLTNMFTFGEDKEQHLLERIATTPTSLMRVLLGHTAFSFVLLFLPILCIIAGAKVIFQVDIGFELFEYFYLLGFICLFATAFSLFMASLFTDSDRSNMLGSTIVVITTVLSGSFFSFEDGNKWLDYLIQVLPQKRYLEAVANLENGDSMITNIAYLLIFTIVLFFFALMKTRKDYVRS
ncbi:ABC transporter permease [Isobaculum melis]|uniref:ABC-2 type transport system permease protein n=1 Tax=Isobaculum melis TaxID=142588 RepID=A0A1H9UBS1_9LACT|nr:ABC transporter permease [Isobaculum melis]SES06905.1 ABC-2 type transport system permease protein [Isobaculum melis]